jgi:hypothetical protein
MAADIIKEEFPWAREIITKNYDSGKEPVAKYHIDGAKLTTELGVTYKPFREAVVDLVKQMYELSKAN